MAFLVVHYMYITINASVIYIIRVSAMKLTIVLYSILNYDYENMCCIYTVLMG
jgi:hypothetical protein